MTYKIPKGNRRISKKEFESHISYFRSEIQNRGFTFKLKKVKNKPVHLSKFNNCDSMGEFNEFDKFIIVHYWGSHWDAIHTIAHEFRHLIHFEQKMFYPYYESLIKYIKKHRKNKKLLQKLVKISFLAEMDCDRFGYQYLNKHNIHYRYEKYPYWGVVTVELVSFYT